MEERRRYHAQFLDGWSLAELQVLVEAVDGALRITDASGHVKGTWDAAGLHSDAMQEGGVLHVTHDSAQQETLVVRDPELERLVLAMCKRVVALPGGKNRWRFIGVAFASLVALGAGLYFGAPIAARFVARQIPLEQERALGAQVELFLDFSRCKDESAQSALQALAKKITHDASEVYETRLMDSEMPNAFALPGGIVIMTTGLLRMADDEAEIAGVLAHEIEHVTQRHVLAGFLRDAVLSAVWALTMGDYAGLMVIDPTTAYRIANLEFSRSDEMEADAGAVKRLHRAGLTHTGLLKFFERIQHGESATDGPEWLSTHPSTDARIARLKVIEDLASPVRALDADQLAALKNACLGGDGAGDTSAVDANADAGVLGGATDAGSASAIED
jgi:Zn-dependent protease with chaperone function